MSREYKPKRMIDRGVLETYKAEEGLDRVGLVAIDNFGAVYDEHGRDVIRDAAGVLAGCLAEMGVTFHEVPGIEQYERDGVTVNEDVWVFAVPPQVDREVVVEQIQAKLKGAEKTKGVDFSVAVKDEGDYELADL